MRKDTEARLKSLFPGTGNGSLKAKMQGNTLEISLYGAIESTDEQTGKPSPNGAVYLKELLDKYPNVSNIRLYINSTGGYVMEGVAMYTLLKRHQAFVEVYIDGVAASIASVIAMAGDIITMGSSSYMMIHNPWLAVSGNAAELRKTADNLDKVTEAVRNAYLDKAGDKLSEQELIRLLDAETFLTAQDAVRYGLCDRIEDAVPSKTAPVQAQDGWFFSSAEQQEGWFFSN